MKQTVASVFAICALLSAFLHFSNGRELHQQTGDSFVNLRPTSWSGVITGDDSEESGFCNYTSTQNDQSLCQGELVCVPVISLLEESVQIEDLSLNEVISTYDIGFQQNSTLPFPVSYFPLEHGDLNTFPFSIEMDPTTGQAPVIQDEIFGKVIDCSENNPIILPSMSFTNDEQWSLAFWFKSPELDKDTSLFLQNGQSDSTDSLIEIFIDAEEDQLKARIQDDDGTELEFVFLDNDSAFAEFEGEVQNRQWHFITLVSLRNQEHYQLYLDGVIIGQTIAQQNMNLSSLKFQDEIQLCPTNFDGSIVHLLLFDQALTPDDVQILYSTFFTSKAQLTGSAAPITTPLTQNGDRCFFPALFRGALIDDCVSVESRLYCPSSPGQWELCSTLQTNSNQSIIPIPIQTQNQNTTVRYSESGKRCETNAIYEGTVISGCVEINGVGHCLVGEGVWEPCSLNSTSIDSSVLAQLINRTTIHGQSCVFPFEYQGGSYEDCIFVESGSLVCRVATGEILPCAIEQKSPPDVSSIVNRLTITNRECFFPLWYGNHSIGECLIERDTFFCLTANGDQETCKPQRLSEEGYPCVFPFPLHGTMRLDCVELEGQERCLTSDGVMRRCIPRESVKAIQIPSQGNEVLKRLVGRITLSGDLCHFPFWYGGNLTDKCVSRTPEDINGICRNTHDELEECYPQRLTIKGEPCAIPYYLNGEPRFDCALASNGSYFCPTVDGEYQLCDLTDGVPIFEALFGSVPEQVSMDDFGLEEVLESDLES